MPVITSPPILLASAAVDNSNQNSSPVGSLSGIAVGSDLYKGVIGIGGAPPFHFRVYKSTDAGATWTRMNQAGEPALGASPTYEAVVAADGIYFVWNDSTFLTGQAFQYKRFDFGTDTWGATFASDDAITTGAFQSIALRSNGDMIVVYQAENVFGNVHWGKFTHAGVWTGEHNFNVTSVQVVPKVAVAGADDTIHVVIQDGAGPFDMYYQKLSPTNVVSAAALITTLGAGTPDSFRAGFPVISTALDQILFPFMDSGVTHTAMFVGKPIAAPVWSQMSLETGLPPTNYSYPFAFITAGNGVKILQTLMGVPPLQAWLTPWNGSALGNPVLYYDALANPPAATPQEMLKVQVAQSAAGVVTWVELELTPGFPPENTYFFGALPMALAIICDNPPAGKVGIPYSHAFPASDGTPPYTFSISAGALPPVLSLDPATGIVSGTPTTSGFYEFSITVTDTLDATATVGCSITIKTCLLGDVA